MRARLVSHASCKVNPGWGMTRERTQAPRARPGAPGWPARLRTWPARHCPGPPSCAAGCWRRGPRWHNSRLRSYASRSPWAACKYSLCVLAHCAQQDGGSVARGCKSSSRLRICKQKPSGNMQRRPVCPSPSVRSGGPALQHQTIATAEPCTRKLTGALIAAPRPASQNCASMASCSSCAQASQRVPPPALYRSSRPATIAASARRAPCCEMHWRRGAQNVPSLLHVQ